MRSRTGSQVVLFFSSRCSSIVEQFTVQYLRVTNGKSPSLFRFLTMRVAESVNVQPEVELRSSRRHGRFFLFIASVRVLSCRHRLVARQNPPRPPEPITSCCWRWANTSNIVRFVLAVSGLRRYFSGWSVSVSRSGVGLQASMAI
jgi:hypothetical protein